MIRLVLIEASPPVVTRLDREVVEALVAADVVSAEPAGPDAWALRAAKKVGVARVGDVEIWIRPKIPIARLLWLMGWATRSVFDAPGPVGLEQSPDLVPVIAEAFCSLAERTLQSGLLQGYREIESRSMVMKGRLRTEEQLAKQFGLPLPLSIRYDDYQVDVPENQILRAAVFALLRLPGVTRAQRSRLLRLRMATLDVEDLASGSTLPAWLPTRLNARYHQTLHLAGIILAGGAVDQNPGQVMIDGFLINLYQVFEDFVTTTLTDALEKIDGQCNPQDPYTLDLAGTIDIRPDLVWRAGGCVRAVIDAKYKAEKPAGFPQADIYQALAYATAYGLDHAHLIYAQGNEPASTSTIRNAGISITAHTLDLEAEPQTLLEQIRAVADCISK